jgi:hypothetical protein
MYDAFVGEMETTVTRGCNKNDVVAKTIDSVLTQVFGKEGASLIYKYLERKYSLKRSEISDKIELFAEGLEDFLSTGADILERKILEDINYNGGMLHRTQLQNDDETNFVTQMKLLMHKA